MNKNIIQKLDLCEYISTFERFLSRKKELFLNGDNKINFEKILTLSNSEFSPPPELSNLDDALARLSKQAVLHISEIYEFSKIIKYFKYLKTLNFDGNLGKWLEKIEISPVLANLDTKFDENGEFNQSVDERFSSLKTAYEYKKEQIKAEFRRLIVSKNLAPYLVDTQIHYINENEALLVRGGFNHFIKAQILARSTSGFFYILPQNVAHLKAQQCEILDKKEQIILEHCAEICKIFTKNLLFLKFINYAFDEFDSLSARALMAKSQDLSFVLPNSSKNIKICEFAHPALNQPKRISIEFSGEILLITGVNAGGKSMLLKSILSAVFMAKYLLPMSINSSNSHIGTFKNLDIIIEDPQNVKNDISTFAGRMIKFSKILREKSTLLGIDEIELGTDFEEASALYSVLIKQLVKNDMKIVITTHHKRLAMALAKETGVELCAALYDEERMVPKFEYLKGVVGKSYAFETALRYGISPNLIAIAKQNYGEDKQNLNTIISKTINTEIKLRKALDETQEKSEKLDILIENLKSKHNENNRIFKDKLNKLEFDFFTAINEAKKALNLSNLKEKQRAINLANKLKSNIEIPSFCAAPKDLQINQVVKYENIKGIIVAIGKNDVIIESGGIKLRVLKTQIEKMAQSSTPKAPKITFDIKKPTNASMILDLHGLRAEEAVNKTQKFISDSLVAGFDEIVIKHGIGTGKLAAVIKNLLENHEKVVSFSDAPPKMGGFGAKIVKL